MAVWKQLLAWSGGDSMLSLARADRAWAEGMCLEDLFKHSLRKGTLIRAPFSRARRASPSIMTTAALEVLRSPAAGRAQGGVKGSTAR